ncbi:glycosyltransferase [Mycobacterium phage Stubby]|uniref:Glycosyltransferase n=1 Tax=Mycobacterium phage Stubby TaxID=2510577 RepID=A0A411AZH6_9CAUD|nr:glycosyltransferase [Mycobacterium phage Stubby]
MGTRRTKDLGAVAIPYRPQPGREQAFELVQRWWKAWGFDVFVADSDPALPFSLSEARNNAVRLMDQSELGPGVVIVCDADTIPQRMVIQKAIQIASEPGHVVYPFTDYRYINNQWAAQAEHVNNDTLCETDFSVATPIWTKEHSVGGILVTHSKTYWELGGMDEKFERCWGFEDNAFVAVADTLAKVIRLDGQVYSFSHDVEGAGRDWSKLNPNYWRNELYRMCWGNTKLMRELIK